MYAENSHQAVLSKLFDPPFAHESLFATEFDVLLTLRFLLSLSLIAMEFYSGFHSSQRIKLTDLGDTLTFLLVPSLGQNLNMPNFIPIKHQQSRIHTT